MLIGFWNICGLNSTIRKSEVKLFVKKNNLDLFALLETKIRPINFEHIRKKLGGNFRTISHACEVSGSDKIWVCWNNNFWDINIHDQFIHLYAKIWVDSKCTSRLYMEGPNWMKEKFYGRRLNKYIPT